MSDELKELLRQRIASIKQPIQELEEMVPDFEEHHPRNVLTDDQHFKAVMEDPNAWTGSKVRFA